jgi:predicted histidine transporter YuiF (NhaC family)
MPTVDAGVVTGAFTLAGTLSGLVIGLVTEYQREKWAGERDTKARQAQRQEERAEFQRTALMDLQTILLKLMVELAEAMTRPTLDLATLRETVFETGMRAGRVFDADARQRVDDALSACVRIRGSLLERVQIAEADAINWATRLHYAQDRIRELLEEQFQA